MTTADISRRCDEALSRPEQEPADGKCVCGDSIGRVVGCPKSTSREYYHCPQRKGLFPVDALFESS